MNRLPNLTTAQRDAVASPEVGDQIWNTTNGRVETWDGTAWVGDTEPAFELARELIYEDTPTGFIPTPSPEQLQADDFWGLLFEMQVIHTTNPAENFVESVEISVEAMLDAKSQNKGTRFWNASGTNQFGLFANVDHTEWTTSSAGVFSFAITQRVWALRKVHVPILGNRFTVTADNATAQSATIDSMDFENWEESIGGRMATFDGTDITIAASAVDVEVRASIVTAGTGSATRLMYFSDPSEPLVKVGQGATAGVSTFGQFGQSSVDIPVLATIPAESTPRQLRLLSLSSNNNQAILEGSFIEVSGVQPNPEPVTVTPPVAVGDYQEDTVTAGTIVVPAARLAYGSAELTGDLVFDTSSMVLGDRARYSVITNGNTVQLPNDTELVRGSIVDGFVNHIELERVGASSLIASIHQTEIRRLVLKQDVTGNANFFADLAEANNFPDPNPQEALKYSILDQVESMRRSDGQIEFELVYFAEGRSDGGILDLRIRWEQTSNPFVNSTNDAGDDQVTGYSLISESSPGLAAQFGGLCLTGASSNVETALYNGQPNDVNWWYSVAATSLWGGAGGIPAAQPGAIGANAYELHVINPGA